jgi:hypothetical protein
LNKGKGKLEDGDWIPVPGGSGCGAAADYNGDGKPDLALNTARGVAILLGTGDAKSPFTTSVTIPLANADCLVTADLNGDGIPDLLVPTSNPPPSNAGTVVAYLGNGDGTFTLKSTTAVPYVGYLVVADFNHDGKLDFATSAGLLALGNGDGTFQTPTAFVAEGLSYIASGDLNGDGWPDLVLTTPFAFKLYIFVNDQHGGFNETVLQLADFTSLYQVALADVNADGRLDAVFADHDDVAIYLGDGQGGLAYEETLDNPIGVEGAPVIVSDLNGDGIPDIGQMSADTFVIFLGTGGGGFADPFFIGTGPSPSDVLVENLHGQPPSAGLPDIVVPDYSGGLTILFNTTK